MKNTYNYKNINVKKMLSYGVALICFKTIYILSESQPRMDLFDYLQASLILVLLSALTIYTINCKTLYLRLLKMKRQSKINKSITLSQKIKILRTGSVK